MCGVKASYSLAGVLTEMVRRCEAKWVQWHECEDRHTASYVCVWMSWDPLQLWALCPVCERDRSTVARRSKVCVLYTRNLWGAEGCGEGGCLRVCVEMRHMLFTRGVRVQILLSNVLHAEIARDPVLYGGWRGER